MSAPSYTHHHPARSSSSAVPNYTGSYLISFWERSHNPIMQSTGPWYLKDTAIYPELHDAELQGAIWNRGSGDFHERQYRVHQLQETRS